MSHPLVGGTNRVKKMPDPVNRVRRTSMEKLGIIERLKPICSAETSCDQVLEWEIFKTSNQLKRVLSHIINAFMNLIMIKKLPSVLL